MKDPELESSRWLQQANYDVQSARYSAQGGFYAAACFQAQQAAEKALKAFLYAQGERIVLGRSVADLCARCVGFDDRFESVKKDLSVLDRLYIPTRYPNGLPGGIPAEAYHSADAEDAVARAGQAIALVTELLNLGEDE